MTKRILLNYSRRYKRQTKRTCSPAFTYGYYYLLLCLLTTLSAGAQSTGQRSPIRFLLPKKSALVYQNGYIGRLYATNVKAEQQEMILFSDRAFYRDSTSELTAYGHVLLVQADSVVVRADTIQYNGDGRLATLRGRVTFQHRRVFLTASQLDYNLSTAIVHYGNNTRIADGNDVRVSSEGYYNGRTRRFTNQSASWLAHSATAVEPIMPVRLATGGPDDVDDGPARKLSVGPVADITFVESSDRLAYTPVAQRPSADKTGAAEYRSKPPARIEESAVEQPRPGRMLVRASRKVTTEPAGAVSSADTVVSELERILNGKKHNR